MAKKVRWGRKGGGGGGGLNLANYGLKSKMGGLNLTNYGLKNKIGGLISQTVA